MSIYDDEAELRAIWESLDGGERETLRCLILKGPVWDGDVPSKAGRDGLLRKGLASKAIVRREQGYQVANYRGWQVYRTAHPEEFESPSVVASMAIESARKPRT
jgi:hypothetical protein